MKNSKIRSIRRLCDLKSLHQYLIPQHSISRIFAKIANSKCCWIKNLLIDSYIKFYKINLQDAVETNPHGYKTFNEFFVRALKPERRPIAQDKNAIISPVDGKIIQVGSVSSTSKIKAKGHNFNIRNLCVDDELVALFKDGGDCVNIYLAPHNYHRIHMPINGVLRKSVYIPGKLFSVNPSIIENIPDVFSRNERLVTLFETDMGPVIIVLVGALIVASIETVWSGIVIPNRYNKICKENYETSVADQISLSRGDELGRFMLGSTVVMIFPKNSVSWSRKLGSSIQMGQLLGQAECMRI